MPVGARKAEVRVMAIVERMREMSKTIQHFNTRSFRYVSPEMVEKWAKEIEAAVKEES
jgi:hypothetical protein